MSNSNRSVIAAKLLANYWSSRRLERPHITLQSTYHISSTNFPYLLKTCLCSFKTLRKLTQFSSPIPRLHDRKVHVECHGNQNIHKLLTGNTMYYDINKYSIHRLQCCPVGPFQREARFWFCTVNCKAQLRI
jgi:hypothetical protein